MKLHIGALGLIPASDQTGDRHNSAGRPVSGVMFRPAAWIQVDVTAATP